MKRSLANNTSSKIIIVVTVCFVFEKRYNCKTITVGSNE